MIKKEDWENALKQYEALYINVLVNIEAYKFMIDLCKKKISEFTDDKEEKIPEELKETLKEIVK